MPSSSALARRSRGDRPTGDPRFCPNSLGGADAQERVPPMRSQQVATLPWFRAGGGYSVPLFAAQSRHEEPYPPMSKINPTFPFILPLTGNDESIPHSPAGFKREMRFLEIVRGGRSIGVRGHAPPRWRLSMRRSRGDRPTIGRSKLRPSRRPRQARPLPLLVSMSHVRTPMPTSPTA